MYVYYQLYPSFFWVDYLIAVYGFIDLLIC